MVLCYGNIIQASSVRATRGTRISLDITGHRRRLCHRNITLYFLEHDVWSKPEETEVRVVPTDRSTRNILLVLTSLVHKPLNLSKVSISSRASPSHVVQLGQVC